MGVQGKRVPRGIDLRFKEPPLITDVESIIKDAVDKKFVDANGNLKLDDIAASYNIIVSYEDLPSTESGYFKKVGVSCKIGINIKHNKKRQRFTFAHELGHFFLHKDKDNDLELRDEVFYRIENSSSIEFAANEFAARLLMPEDRVKKKIDEGINDLKDLADFFEVSQEAMRYRVISLGYKVETNG